MARGGARAVGSWGPTGTSSVVDCVLVAFRATRETSNGHTRKEHEHAPLYLLLDYSEVSRPEYQKYFPRSREIASEEEDDNIVVMPLLVGKARHAVQDWSLGACGNEVSRCMEGKDPASG